ncbi:hypothetical protein TW95_gp1000 [Pandoravirus inopinatum]|uniref:Uncharacterized protein n=1 Tax=Pandoravirus inopinatum TaxID=1605721 RepID=A0A0B5J2G1_9VIRU|nr:hypothetical protein TW95_gp1000 [Pandoravirus inopinatum]AJF97734.1 hypothetical protein [Pandoravirus inopinatum]
MNGTRCDERQTAGPDSRASTKRGRLGVRRVEHVELVAVGVAHREGGRRVAPCAACFGRARRSLWIIVRPRRGDAADDDLPDTSVIRTQRRRQCGTVARHRLPTAPGHVGHDPPSVGEAATACALVQGTAGAGDDAPMCRGLGVGGGQCVGYRRGIDDKARVGIAARKHSLWLQGLVGACPYRLDPANQLARGVASDLDRIIGMSNAGRRHVAHGRFVW